MNDITAPEREPSPSGERLEPSWLPELLTAAHHAADAAEHARSGRSIPILCRVDLELPSSIAIHACKPPCELLCGLG
ncbi:hypothetical protein [Streptomyces sp. BE230]|uniref:hypothetical protein n=1 Tax=Streptomyces sp. BE230 TaxID=3002526 RepID=UPI002ED4A0AF|nr:hypothetical protein [Streptomyces sp. BE230]